MKISIITVCYNSETTIRDTIESIVAQDFPSIEYIIIDGASTDKTLDIVKEFELNISRVVSEPDEGVYAAMNKGIKLATGDIIGFLNADDIFNNKNVLHDINAVFTGNDSVQACYADLVYVDKHNTDRVVRYWQSENYRSGCFSKGWVPAHPTFYARKRVYDRHGGFDEEFKYAADYDLMVRFIEVKNIQTCYLPEVIVRMRMGGKTNKNLLNIIKGNIEIYKISKKNNIRLSPFYLLHKSWSRISQFLKTKRQAIRD